MTRSNYIFLLCGMPFTGKTTFLLQAVEKTNKPTIVLDNLVHPAYKNNGYHVITNVDDIKKPIKQNTVIVTNRNDYMNCVELILMYQSNINFALEDCKRFISDNPQNAIMNLVSDFRKFNIDVYFMYHAIKFIPIKIATMADILVLFQTNESIEKNILKSRFSKWEDVVNIFNSVNGIGQKKKKDIHHKEILFLTMKKQ